MNYKDYFEIEGDCDKDFALAIVCFFVVLALAIPAYTFLSGCAGTASANTGDGRSEFVDLNALAAYKDDSSKEASSSLESKAEAGSAANQLSKAATSVTVEANKSTSSTVAVEPPAKEETESPEVQPTQSDSLAEAAQAPSTEGPAQSEDVCVGDVVFK